MPHCGPVTGLSACIISANGSVSESQLRTSFIRYPEKWGWASPRSFVFSLFGHESAARAVSPVARQEVAIVTASTTDMDLLISCVSFPTLLLIIEIIKIISILFIIYYI